MDQSACKTVFLDFEKDRRTDLEVTIGRTKLLPVTASNVWLSGTQLDSQSTATRPPKKAANQHASKHFVSFVFKIQDL